MFVQRLARNTPPAATSDKLWQYVEAAWTSVPQGYIESVFDSMPRRSSVTVVKEFRRLKRIRRGPVTPYALRKMIQKFETTGQFGILPGRRRKHIPSSSTENVATAVVEASSQSLDDSMSVPVVSRVLDMSYSTVRKSYGQFCINIPTKPRLGIN
ncbi:DUF4817 domain-containing protein [Trichonephila clavipes]|nr:DUF4817 domain-containing protein [Trichonephila clavipes]